MKRRIAQFILMGLVLAVAAATVALAWHLRERTRRVYTDAQSIREPAESARLREILWQPALHLPAPVRSRDEEAEPAVSPDGTALYFVRGRPGHGTDIYVSLRGPSGWSEPQALEGVNSEADELGPAPGPSGDRLYFASDRAGGLGGYDIWMVRRQDEGWTDAVNLGPAVNSAYHDYGASAAADGSVLYFSSNRPRPGDATAPAVDAPRWIVLQDVAKRDFDIHIAPLGEDGSAAGAASAAGELNGPHHEGAPAISPAGDFVYFASDRPGGEGGFDVYRSRRLHGQHTPPQNLGRTLNSPANELDPALTLGGFGIFFSSDRPAAPAAPLEPGAAEAVEGGPAQGDLYFAASREVFADIETHRAAIDWAGLWAAIWPYLLALILALLLILALARVLLARPERFGRLSLIARCLLASLLLHLLLMLLFTVWEVSISIADFIARGSSTRVILASAATSSARGQVAGQVRGGLVQMEVEAPRDAPLERHTQPMEAAAAATSTAMDVAPSQPQVARLLAQAEVEDARADATGPAEADRTAEIEPASPGEVTLPQPAAREAHGEAQQGPTVASGMPAPTPAPPEASAAAGPAARVEMDVSEAAVEDRAALAAAEVREAQPQMPAQPLKARVLERSDAPDADLPLLPQRPAERVAETAVHVRAAPGEVARQSPASTNAPSAEDRSPLAAQPLSPGPARADAMPAASALAPAVSAHDSAATSAPRPRPRGALAPAPGPRDLAIASPSGAAEARDVPESALEVPLATAPAQRAAAREVRVSIAAVNGPVEVAPTESRDAAPLERLAQADANDSPPPRQRGARAPVNPPAVAPARAAPDVDVPRDTGAAAQRTAIAEEKAGPIRESGPHTSRAAASIAAASSAHDARPASVSTLAAPGGVPGSVLASGGLVSVDAPDTPLAARQPLSLPGEPRDMTLDLEAVAVAVPVPGDVAATVDAAAASDDVTSIASRKASGPRPPAAEAFAPRGDASVALHPVARPGQRDSKALADAVAVDSPAARRGPSDSHRPVEVAAPRAAPALALALPSPDSLPGAAADGATAPELSRSPGTETARGALPRGLVDPVHAGHATIAPVRGGPAAPQQVLATATAEPAPARSSSARAAQPSAPALDLSSHGIEPPTLPDGEPAASPRAIAANEPVLELTPAAALRRRAAAEPLAHDIDRKTAAAPSTLTAVEPRALPLSDGRPLLARAPARGEVDLSRVPAHTQVPRPLSPLAALATVDLALPKDGAPLSAVYEQRAPEVRQEFVERFGGSRETERAVELALQWLARNQSPQGHWDSMRVDARSGGAAKVRCDIALTGLSLLCFLAADHSHIKDGPYRDNVERGLRWLVEHQAPTGSLIGEESMYSHGIASIALAEAYGMTGEPALAQPVARAISFIYEARNRQIGGWRYEPGQAGDTSVLGWQVMALMSARRAGVNVPEDAFNVARRWLSKVEREDEPGLYAYQPKRRVTPAMTAEGLFVWQLTTAGASAAEMAGSVAYLLNNPPKWEDDANTYYWYYATLALFQNGGDAWETWNGWIKDELLGRQRTEGDAAGSWNPDGKWANVGGRVYQTAICTLTLEVYYRYLPLFVAEPPLSQR